MSLSVTLVSATRLPGAGELLAGLAVALVVVLALAWVMRRSDLAFPLLVFLALPFRVPISTQGRTVNLLVPLYLVVGAGILAHLLPHWLERARGASHARGARGAPHAHGARGASHAHGAREGPAGGRPPGAPAEPAPRLRTPSSWLTPRGTEWLLLAAVALYLVQTAYSNDRVKALENLAFFYVPFAALFLIAKEIRWTRELLARCLAIAVTLAVLFAGVGFVEYFRKSLFLNPKVVAADQYANYFRVNSVFFDPSIYGRFLALVMIALMAVLLSLGMTRGRAGTTDARPRRDLLGAFGRPSERVLLAGGAILLWLLFGLVTSFSQSSIAALLLGLAVLGAWCWGVRLALAVSGALVVLVLAVVLLAPAGLHFGLKGSSGSAANATSGRTTLVTGGLELFAKRPLEGYGSGSFETEYKRHNRTGAVNATSASHTIPVTVAAEQGLVGLAVYLALLASAFAMLFRDAGRSPPRIAIAACFAALVLHTWTYADFLEDPTTWLLLAIGVALARETVRPPRAPAGAGETLAPASSV